jgi:hypothetical protein
MIVGFSTLNDEDFNSGIAIGWGAGLVGLGALGIGGRFKAGIKPQKKGDPGTVAGVTL